LEQYIRLWAWLIAARALGNVEEWDHAADAMDEIWWTMTSGEHQAINALASVFALR